MTTTFTVEGALVTQDCGKCGGIFAISQDYYKECCRDHSQSWYCPYCKIGWHRTGMTDEQRATARAERAESDARDVRCRNATLRRRLSATKGIVTRTKNRVSKGVCPRCNRHFEQLQRHMASKHPEYVTQ